MGFRVYFSLLFITISFQGFAQIDSSEIYNDPYSVIYNHLYYLQTDSYDPERAALSLPSGDLERTELSIKLKQILDGKGLFLDLNRIPKDSLYRDSLTGEEVYFLNDKETLIYVEKINGNWIYSRTTVESIPSLHKSVYPFGTQFVSYFHAPF